MTTLLVIGSIIGTGLSVASQYSAAKASDNLAMLNAQASTQAARQQGHISQAQAQLEAIKAKKEQEAAFSDAAAMRMQAEAESRANQENIRRSREDFGRALSQQRAAIAARGVVDTTGSPLELLVKSASDQALFEAEQRNADEINRRGLFNAANQRQTQGRVAGLNVGMAMLNAAAAQQQARMQATQARLDLFSTQAANRGARWQAAGTALAGVTSAGRDWTSLRRNTTPRGYA